MGGISTGMIEMRILRDQKCDDVSCIRKQRLKIKHSGCTKHIEVSVRII